MSPKIVLTHIPRTGGTSLFAALREKMPSARAAEFSSFSELALMSDRDLNRHELISTYVGSRLFDRLDDTWTKIVVFRDPVARLRSSYWHLRTTEKNYSFASSIAKANDFAGYLASRESAVIFQATNTQTWCVAGDKSLHYRERFASANASAVLDLALERLQLYDIIGLTESLDDFWAALCARFGWKLTPLPRLRGNPSALTMPDAAREDWEFHTGLDREFCQAARGLALRGTVGVREI